MFSMTNDNNFSQVCKAKENICEDLRYMIIATHRWCMAFGWFKRYINDETHVHIKLTTTEKREEKKKPLLNIEFIYFIDTVTKHLLSSWFWWLHSYALGVLVVKARFMCSISDQITRSRIKKPGLFVTVQKKNAKHLRWIHAELFDKQNTGLSKEFRASTQTNV
jgi:hypothetical protein